MSISREEVAKVALLARLRLGEAELDALTTQMGQILQYMELLQEVDTTDIEPMAHAIEVFNVLRADEPRPSLSRDAALAGAPHRDDECYRVPAVLGD